VFVWRAAAVLSVLRANAVTILRNFPCDELRFSESRNQIAHQLRFANTARVPPDDDHAIL
jgi:hypothetical protein